MDSAAVAVAAIDTPRSDRRSRAHRILDLLAAPIISVLVTLLLMWRALEAWSIDLHQPLRLFGDGLFSLEVVKTVVEHGWYWDNPDVGAPFGQEMLDFPVYAGDTLSLLAIKALGWVADDPVAIANVFYLATYPLVAFVAAFVARRWSMSTAVAVAVASLFALAPYHFARGFGHYFLSAYMTVPIGVHLALCIMTGAVLFGRTADLSRRASGMRTAGACALCVACGLGGLYYAAFSILLIAAAGLFAAISSRSLRPAIPALVCVALIAGALGAAAVPNVLHLDRVGANPEVGQREPFESELYGLKVGNLLVPIPNHRVARLAEFRAEFGVKSPVPGESGTELGVVASAGFLGLLLLIVVRTPGPVSAYTFRQRVLGCLAVLTLVCVLVGAVGGLGALFAEVVSPQIRAWNRISIVIMFLALMAVGLALQSAVDRLARGRRLTWALGVAVAIAVTVVGYMDQTNPKGLTADRARIAEQFGTTILFVDELDRRLPEDAAIYQLPYVPFPEHPPIHAMTDYDHFRPYIHDADLRWSYGAIRGRAEDWAAELEDVTPSELPRLVAAAGFSGIYVDRYGYADRGASLEASLSETLGPVDVASRDGRYAFYDLAQARDSLAAELDRDERAALKQAVLEPVDIELDGFHDLERNELESWRWMAPTASIAIPEDAGAPRTYLLRGQVENPSGSTIHLTVDRSEPPIRRLAIPPRGRAYLELTLELGAGRVDVTTDAPLVQAAPGDDRDLAIRWVGFQLEPAALDDLR